VNHRERVERAWEAVRGRLDAEAVLLGGWVDAPRWPTLPEGAGCVDLVFALPAWRVAGLRSWRDQAEAWQGGELVVAAEASVWARQLLRSHGGVAARVVHGDRHDPHGLLGELGVLAATGSDPVVAGWFAAARGVLPTAVAPSAGGAVLAGPERFGRLEAWLTGARGRC
jgi:hypothetical protein